MKISALLIRIDHCAFFLFLSDASQAAFGCVSVGVCTAWCKRKKGIEIILFTDYNLREKCMCLYIMVIMQFSIRLIEKAELATRSW